MNIVNFYKSLEIMGQGMSGILVVMAVFYIMIKALTKMLPQK